ncbi:hypothetical protein BC829DRAFT_405569, partial [Chytridium lagenaria]
MRSGTIIPWTLPITDFITSTQPSSTTADPPFTSSFWTTSFPSHSAIPQIPVSSLSDIPKDLISSSSTIHRIASARTGAPLFALFGFPGMTSTDVLQKACTEFFLKDSTFTLHITKVLSKDAGEQLLQASSSRTFNPYMVRYQGPGVKHMSRTDKSFQDFYYVSNECHHNDHFKPITFTQFTNSDLPEYFEITTPSPLEPLLKTSLPVPDQPSFLSSPPTSPVFSSSFKVTGFVDLLHSIVPGRREGDEEVKSCEVTVKNENSPKNSNEEICEIVVPVEQTERIRSFF